MRRISYPKAPYAAARRHHSTPIIAVPRTIPRSARPLRRFVAPSLRRFVASSLFPLPCVTTKKPYSPNEPICRLLDPVIADSASENGFVFGPLAGRHGGHLSKTADFARDDDRRIASPARGARPDHPEYGEPMATRSVMRAWGRLI